MYKLNLGDTIVAISTPIGQAGIGIVRLSGKDSLKIADEIFISKEDKKPSDFKTYTIHYGWIAEKQKAQSGKRKTYTGIIDEVILTIMRAPKTYTREDIVEINCHSGVVPLKKILDLVVSKGARIAKVGEFTRRAFLNGRIDLAQAEAVLDIIESKTESSFNMGFNQLRGGLSSHIENIGNNLLDILAHLEADIDFPEDDIDTSSLKKIKNTLGVLQKELAEILKNADQGKILREGIDIVICGKPNVGKSSLLNAFVREERAIVTSVAGTTRDTIEEVVNIKGVPFKIVDTAGIIEPKNLIETESIKRSRARIRNADLILLVLDASHPISQQDRMLIEEIKDKKTLVVCNKADLPSKISREMLRPLIKNRKVVKISALKMKGLTKLEDAILDMVWQGEVVAGEDILVSNVRHIDLLRKTLVLVEKSISAISDRLSHEFVAEYIKVALDNLAQITGRNITEDLLDKIFSEFCIGK